MEFKVGQKVYDVIFGDGVVIGIYENNSYPVRVKFGNGDLLTFTLDGWWTNRKGAKRTLFPYPVKIVRADAIDINEIDERISKLEGLVALLEAEKKSMDFINQKLNISYG